MIGHDWAFYQHTESGVTTSDSFIDYIDGVNVPYCKNRPSTLIVDAYDAHLTEKVRNHCKNNNIQLLVVPERGTSALQPLDVGVFGAAKSHIRHEYRESITEKDRVLDSEQIATKNCVTAIRAVTRHAVIRAWKLVHPEWIDVLAKWNITE